MIRAIPILLVAASCKCTPSSRPAESGATPPLPSASSGTTLGARRYTRIVTVSGSGEADVQRALDEARERAIVVVPAGRYTIDGTIEVRGDDLLLVGLGPEATIFARSADDGDHIRPMLRSRGKKNVEVSGIRFEGVATDG